MFSKSINIFKIIFIEKNENTNWKIWIIKSVI